MKLESSKLAKLLDSLAKDKIGKHELETGNPWGAEFILSGKKYVVVEDDYKKVIESSWKVLDEADDYLARVV